MRAPAFAAREIRVKTVAYEMRGGFLGKTRFACPDIGVFLGFSGAARAPGKGAREGPSSLDGNGRQPFASRKDSRAEIAMDAAASSPGSISAKSEREVTSRRARVRLRNSVISRNSQSCE